MLNLKVFCSGFKRAEAQCIFPKQELFVVVAAASLKIKRAVAIRGKKLTCANKPLLFFQMNGKKHHHYHQTKIT